MISIRTGWITPAAAHPRGIRVDPRILPGKPHDILNEPEVIPALRDLIAKVTRTR